MHVNVFSGKSNEIVLTNSYAMLVLNFVRPRIQPEF